MESLEQLLARTAAGAAAAVLELDEAALDLRHQAEYILQEATGTADPARRRLRQTEGSEAVVLAREVERLVGVQRRLATLAADTLMRARHWEAS